MPRVNREWLSRLSHAMCAELRYSLTAPSEVEITRLVERWLEDHGPSVVFDGIDTPSEPLHTTGNPNLMEYEDACGASYLVSKPCSIHVRRESVLIPAMMIEKGGTGLPMHERPLQWRTLSGPSMTPRYYDLVHVLGWKYMETAPDGGLNGVSYNYQFTSSPIRPREVSRFYTAAELAPHLEYNLGGAQTGRWSTRNPNAQPPAPIEVDPTQAVAGQWADYYPPAEAVTPGSYWTRRPGASNWVGHLDTSDDVVSEVHSVPFTSTQIREIAELLDSPPVITGLEARGLQVNHSVIEDYLASLPTTGAAQSGPESHTHERNSANTR